jgi:hypothetical protein
LGENRLIYFPNAEKCLSEKCCAEEKSQHRKILVRTVRIIIMRDNRFFYEATQDYIYHCVYKCNIYQLASANISLFPFVKAAEATVWVVSILGKGEEASK